MGWVKAKKNNFIFVSLGQLVDEDEPHTQATPTKIFKTSSQIALFV